LAPAAAPVAVAAVPEREPWYRSVFTDREGEFDTGRVLVAIVIFALIYFEYVHVTVHGNPFDAQSFGIAVAGILGGFAAYLYGDAKRPPAPVPSTTTDIRQQQVTTP
jgi:hypothetical protein